MCLVSATLLQFAVLHTNWFEIINQPHVHGERERTHTRKEGKKEKKEKVLVDCYPHEVGGYKMFQVLCQVDMSQNVNCIPAVVIRGRILWQITLLDNSG